VDRKRIIQIVLAVLVLIGFCIGLFVYFGSSSHVNPKTSPTSVEQTAPTTPGYQSTPDSVTGPTPAPGR
jgi:hypothetical protein